MSASHGCQVAGMFGRIAGWYDFLNHFLSLGLDIHWRSRLVAQLNLPSTRPTRVLDLAAGTLDVSLAVAKRNPLCRIAAADFCLPMLRRGQAKLARRKVGAVDPVQADALALPFVDECFDGATIAFGIRNILPREGAYAEILRTLKPGGRLCILEFGSGRQRIWGGVYNLYLNRLLPRLGKLFSKDHGAYEYLARTIREFPDAKTLERELQDAGFVRVWHESMASGIVVVHVAVKGVR